MPAGDGSRARYDNRNRHDGKVSPELSSACITLTPEEIANMDPTKPTNRQIKVDELPRERESLSRSLEKVMESVQSTLNAIHRRATKELQLLDEKQLQSLSTIATTLIRIQNLNNNKPIDPSKLSDEELDALTKE